MSLSRELFEHLKDLLPNWNVRRGYCGVDRKRRLMVYTIPGLSYHPEPAEVHDEHSLRLVVLLPTEKFDEYEIFLVPLRLWGSKYKVRDGAFYVRYGTDYVSRMVAKTITLPGATKPEKVAQRASQHLSRGFDGLTHFLKKNILREQGPRKISKPVISRYIKKLSKEGFGEDTPPWLQFMRLSYGNEFYFDTNIVGSEKQYGNTFKRVQITGILSITPTTQWNGTNGVNICCFVSAFQPGHSAHWPWKMPSCYSYFISGMPTYAALKFAILSFGNGGGAAQAAHFALDSVGRFLDDEKHPRPVIDLGSNCGNITAIGNDYSFGQIFRHQLMAFDMIAKVAVGISTSGTSENVLNALAYANARGIKTILLTSDRCSSHGLSFVDEVVRAPSKETPVIQEIHIMVIHLWCQAMEEAGFPKQSNKTNN